MKIVHISTNDIAGGAARAAFRLHSGLVRIGHDSAMLVKHRTSQDSHVQVFQTGWSTWRRVLGAIRARRIEADLCRYPSALPANGGMFSDNRSRFKDAVADAVPECDVVNLHWVASDFVDYEGLLSALAVRNIPVVWTLHDMNVLTGGCHYDGGCGRYREQCGSCPQLGRDASTTRDLSRQIWDRKRRAFERAFECGLKLQIVAPSRWLAECARQSPLLKGLPVNVIAYGIDADRFKPLESVGLRQALGVRRDANIVLFVSDNLRDERKGLSQLVQALKRLPLDEMNVHLVGVGKSMPAAGLDGLNATFTGEIVNERFMSLAYSAADLFVIPSKQDNLPNTVLEAMACGTPVVGFDVGGIPDMVRSGETGLLASAEDVSGLAAAIRSLLEDEPLRRRMGEACRETVLQEYALEQQAEVYAMLYQEMTA